MPRLSSFRGLLASLPPPDLCLHFSHAFLVCPLLEGHHPLDLEHPNPVGTPLTTPAETLFLNEAIFYALGIPSF